MTLLISQQLHITFTTMLTKAYGTREGSMMHVSVIIDVHFDFVTLCIRDSYRESIFIYLYGFCCCLAL